MITARDDDDGFLTAIQDKHGAEPQEIVIILAGTVIIWAATITMCAATVIIGWTADRWLADAVIRAAPDAG